jgi:hypothetical protein
MPKQLHFYQNRISCPVYNRNDILLFYNQSGKAYEKLIATRPLKELRQKGFIQALME